MWILRTDRTKSTATRASSSFAWSIYFDRNRHELMHNATTLSIRASDSASVDMNVRRGHYYLIAKLTLSFADLIDRDRLSVYLRNVYTFCLIKWTTILVFIYMMIRVRSINNCLKQLFTHEDFTIAATAAALK